MSRNSEQSLVIGLHLKGCIHIMCQRSNREVQAVHWGKSQGAQLAPLSTLCLQSIRTESPRKIIWTSCITTMNLYSADWTSSSKNWTGWTEIEETWFKSTTWERRTLRICNAWLMTRIRLIKWTTTSKSTLWAKETKTRILNLELVSQTMIETKQSAILEFSKLKETEKAQYWMKSRETLIASIWCWKSSKSSRCMLTIEFKQWTRKLSASNEIACKMMPKIMTFNWSLIGLLKRGTTC